MGSPDWSIGPIDHIGIAVRNLDEAMAFYRDTMGLPMAEIEEVADQMVRTAIFFTGEGRVELLEPTHPDSPIAKFLEKRGEGIHHMAIRVTDIQAKLAELEASGAQLIDRTPRVGAGGHLIAFIHPKAAHGVLLELTQPCAHQEGELSRH